MQCLTTAPGAMEDFPADVVVVPLRTDTSSHVPVPAAATSCGARLTEVATQLGLRTAGSNALLPSAAIGDWRAPLLLLVHVGPADGCQSCLTSIRESIAIAVRRLAPHAPQRVVLPFAELACHEWPAGHLAEVLVESAVLGSYAFDRYCQTSPAIGELVFPGMSEDHLRIGCVIADATNLARDLVNTPGADMVPADLAQRCVTACRDRGIPTHVMAEDELAAGGFEAILGVGRGSAHPPRLVVIGEPPAPGAGTALVGKGITFDTGGLSLKDAMPMVTMKCDMAGAASVLAAVTAAADLGIGSGLVGYLACAENSVGAASYRPSDVLTHRNGKTTEIISTDAEGRLVLADALALAAESRPARIVDIATLTGATGLGPDLWGLLGNNAELSQSLIAAGRLAGEPGWELPLWDGYRGSLQSNIADLKNYDPDAKWGNGAILGALYLREFVAELPWAHLDTAATAFREEASPAWAAGATGSPVRTLVTWLRTLADRDARGATSAPGGS